MHERSSHYMYISTSSTSTFPDHWRQPRRGCRGHIPQYFGWGTSTGISPNIITYFRIQQTNIGCPPLSLKPISVGYKTPPIRFSQAGGQSAHKARPPNLELALTPLFLTQYSGQSRMLQDFPLLYTRDASAVLAVALCLSVCLSVCTSVKGLSSIKTVGRIELVFGVEASTYRHRRPIRKFG